MNGSIKSLSPLRFLAWMIGYIAFGAACVAIAPLFGSQHVDLSKALDFSIPAYENQGRAILFTTRIPRIMLAFVAGGSLALSGAVMQALLRNPLASPFTLGVASGGTLGAAIVLLAGGTMLGIFTVSGTVAGAFVMSLLTLLLVWALANNRGRITTGTLLLAGVSINFFFGAIVLLLQYTSDFEQNFALIRWMMGSLDAVGYDSVNGIFPVLVLSIIVLFFYARIFNVMALGDEAAETSGISTNTVKIVCFAISGLLAGAAVSQVGPIGFVGLIVPHAVRMISGPDYRLVLPASVLAGGGFLVLCDLLSRTVMAPTELPPGIITAMLGAPFFLWLLKSKAREIMV